MDAMADAKLSIGPLLFNWDDDKRRDFYFRIADEAPVDTVFLGEVICTRRGSGENYLADVIERLERGGKKVIISSLALVMDDKDMKKVENCVSMAPDYMVEANDLSAVQLLGGAPHAIGPFINVYNEATLRFFEKEGAKRISLNHELSSRKIRAIAAVATAELEVQVFGRLPLAISARCYHARVHNLGKTGCQYVCNQDPDGLTVDTLDSDPFLVINGLQTMSYSYCNLVNELEDMAQMGIKHFRLSPHDVDMVLVSQFFRDHLDGKIEADMATEALEDEVPGAEFSNGFYHGEAGMSWIEV